MADERGAFGGGQPGEWTPSAGPNPGAGWAPIGGIQGRAYSPYQHLSSLVWYTMNIPCKGYGACE